MQNLLDQKPKTRFLGGAPMSNYTIRWVPIGPEVRVDCKSLDEAIALVDELVSIGQSERIRIERDGCCIPIDPRPEQAEAPHWSRTGVDDLSH